MVRIEDLRQAPGTTVELGDDFGGIRRIDSGGRAGLEIVQQETVVATETRKLRDFEIVRETNADGRRRC